MLNPAIDPTMKAILLPAPLIIKNFVHGEQKCNYEIYLLELLNHSKVFSQKYPGEFQRPSSESQGECDAISNNYQIDFKLLASKTALQARSLLSSQIYKEGAITSFSGSRSNKSISTTRIFAAFRGLSLDDLVRIRNSSNKRYGIENDIYTVLKALETKKNLLLFFPYEFKFTEPHKTNEALESIIKALNHDFRSAFQYRSIYSSEYDTFLVCIYGNYFLLFSVVENAIFLQEKVNVKNLQTFVELLYRYGDCWN